MITSFSGVYRAPKKHQFSFRKALDVRAQRKALLSLSAKELADIGITREDAILEARRAFWDF